MYAMERAIARRIYADILHDMQDIGYLEPSLADYYLEKMGDLPGKEISPFEPIMQDDVVLVQEGIDEILPDSARDLESVLGKRSTQMAQIVAQVNLLSTMPFVFVIALYSNNPHHFDSLNATAGGRLMILGCLACILLGGEAIRYVAHKSMHKGG